MEFRYFAPVLFLLWQVSIFATVWQVLQVGLQQWQWLLCKQIGKITFLIVTQYIPSYVFPLSWFEWIWPCFVLNLCSGFRMNASSWPMFLLRTLSGAEMAPASAFKKVPTLKGSYWWPKADKTIWYLHWSLEKLNELASWQRWEQHQVKWGLT